MGIDYYGQLPPWVLGSVSQSGGIPTDALIERGSNANGEYVRFADGTQRCTRVCDINVASTASQTFAPAAGFASGALVIATAGFINSTPNVALYPSNWRGFGFGTGTFFFRLQSAGVSSAPGTAAEQIILSAEGRWF